jgi:tetratricopeptide (TPR) repeat protein
MNKIYTLLILALFLGMSSSYAQSTSLRSIEKSAEKAMENKNFFAAWKFYQMTTTQRSVKKDSTKLAKQMYKLGEAARQFKSYEIARDAYKMVLASKSRADYPLVEFWLARVYHSQGEYKDAITHYTNFEKEAGQTPKGGTVNSKQEYAAVAKSAIQNCNWAKDQKRFNGFKIDSLKSVNTVWTEFAPLEHNSSMYYSALEFDEANYCPDPNSEVTRLYTSDYAGAGGTTSPINWAKEKKGTFVAHTAFNTNGDRMYFTICNRINAAEFECEIYYRDKSSGLWGDAIRLPEAVNLAGSTNTQPNIGYDENLEKELLFFVSNRADSLGGANSDMNIFCSIIEADGRVSAPGKIDVNTLADDVTPFFNKKNKTLYFSSKGYQGFGGYDIYKAKQKEKGSGFVKPSALEKPINSSYDDYYFSADDEMETMYFSTNRLGVTYNEDEVGLETCCDDIYKLEIIKVKLEVTTFNTLTAEEGLDSCEVALYDVTNPSNPILVGEKKLDLNGNFYEFPLELEKDYRVESVRGKRWTNADSTFTTRGITTSQTIKKQLYHTPDIIWNIYTFVRTDECSPGSMVSLPKCTFDFTNKLSGESSSELEDDNHFKTILEPEKEYEIVGMPENPFFEAYLESSNTKYRSTKGYTTPTTLNDTLYFKFSKNFNVEVLLYYHNDYPKRVEGTNGRIWDENEKITNDKYDTLYNKYIAEKERLIYKKENKNMGGLGNSDIVIDTFFNDHVIANFEKIGFYISVLESLADVFKDSECQIQLDITGYTSPRAPAAYNEKLGYRRTYCFIEYIKDQDKPKLRNVLPENVEDESKLFNFIFRSEGERPDLYTVIDGVERLGGEILNISDNGIISIYGIGSSKRRKVKVGKITVQPKSSSSQLIR